MGKKGDIVDLFPRKRVGRVPWWVTVITVLVPPVGVWLILKWIYG